MSNTKSTRIIAIGVAVFVIGAALLFLVLHKNKSSNSSSSNVAAPPTTTTIPGAITVGVTPTPTAFQFTIPSGDNAVAVSMSYFPGIGGYVKAGDLVNAYSVIKGGCSPSVPNGVRILLSNVKVLEVLGSPPASNGQPASFLLALNPVDAAKVIYAESFESLYFTLTTGNEPSMANLGVLCAESL
jgi:Flp pilus assembly protein CpaB